MITLKVREVRCYRKDLAAFAIRTMESLVDNSAKNYLIDVAWRNSLTYVFTMLIEEEDWTSQGLTVDVIDKSRSYNHMRILMRFKHKDAIHFSEIHFELT